jgi:hypothetical protein
MANVIKKYQRQKLSKPVLCLSSHGILTVFSVLLIFISEGIDSIVYGIDTGFV